MQGGKQGFLFPQGENVGPLTVFFYVWFFGVFFPLTVFGTKGLQGELTLLHLSDDW